MNILTEDFKTYGQNVIDQFKYYAEKQQGWEIVSPNFEGIRVNLSDSCGNGWFLLRLSLHDPLLPLNIESNSEGGVKIIAKQLASFFSGFAELDSSKLQASV